MQKIFLFLCCGMVSFSLAAQKYTTAAGVRVGGGIGLTVQQALWDKYTAEVQLQKGFTNSLTTFTALFEQHHNILTRGANFYIGAGPHYGTYREGGKGSVSEDVIGASFIGGLEFKLGSTILSFDYKPMLNFSGGPGFFDSQAGISLRYVFLKAAKKEHKWMFWKKDKGGKKKDSDD